MKNKSRPKRKKSMIIAAIVGLFALTLTTLMASNTIVQMNDKTRFEESLQTIHSLASKLTNLTTWRVASGCSRSHTPWENGDILCDVGMSASQAITDETTMKKYIDQTIQILDTSSDLEKLPTNKPLYPSFVDSSAGHSTYGFKPYRLKKSTMNCGINFNFTKKASEYVLSSDFDCSDKAKGIWFKRTDIQD